MYNVFFRIRICVNAGRHAQATFMANSDIGETYTMFSRIRQLYRGFIVRYSQLAVLLYELTKKDVQFVWQSHHQKSSDALKHAFIQAPLMSHFRPSAACVVETDASDFAIGMILSQVHK